MIVKDIVIEALWEAHSNILFCHMILLLHIVWIINHKYLSINHISMFINLGECVAGNNQLASM